MFPLTLAFSLIAAFLTYKFLDDQPDWLRILIYIALLLLVVGVGWHNLGFS